MTFSERKGNLFEADDLDALAHGVNCKGVMGAGIAKEFARRWSDILPPYREFCQGASVPLGAAWLYIAGDGTLIFNLTTQRRPGPDAKLRWVAQAVGNMLEQAELTGVKRIGMPRIGCGIGGLEWVEVRMIVELLANESPVEVVVFSL
jgi:O-acetyl-ADP-ribose deacetylase (regulator of RNase III)